MNQFEIATRKKLRFKSPKGELTAEQLWDVPLRSRDNFNLDALAKLANYEVKEFNEESFVESRKNTKQVGAELAFDIIKHVIGVKLAEEEAKTKRADNQKEKEKILSVMADKEDDELKGLTTKQLENRLKKVSD